MTVAIERLPGGPWDENCYLVVSGDEALIVDPGGSGDEVLQAVEGRRLSAVGILATHGHFDHIAGVVAISEATGLPLTVSGRDRRTLRSANLHSFVCGFGKAVRVPEVGVDLDGLGPVLRFGDIELQSIPTPGHTPGSYAFLVGSSLLGGDTILGDGLSDNKLPGGDLGALAESRARLRAEVDPGVTLLPGHGAPRSLGDALRNLDLAASSGG